MRKGVQQSVPRRHVSISAQFFVVLSGPPAVGKNTVAREISRHFPRTLATVDLDQLKRFVEADPRTDQFLDLAAQVAMSMARVYLSARLSVVVHNAFCKYDFVRPFLSLAAELQVPASYFKLIAPLEELLRRNHARSHPCSEADIQRIYAFDRRNQHSAGRIIDTMRYGPDESADLILRLVSMTRGKG
jgi:tRNA uridine 5-carbamoylmethylation protein Kti12